MVVVMVFIKKFDPLGKFPFDLQILDKAIDLTHCSISFLIHIG